MAALGLSPGRGAATGRRCSAYAYEHAILGCFERLSCGDLRGRKGSDEIRASAPIAMGVPSFVLWLRLAQEGARDRGAASHWRATAMGLPHWRPSHGG